MMYISPVLLVILYVYIGFSAAAPRINPNDASPISRRSDSSSDTWETVHTDMPHTLPDGRFTLGPHTGLITSPGIVPSGLTTSSIPFSKTATKFQPSKTDLAITTSTTTTPVIGINSYKKEQALAPISRGAQKRSTDAQTSLFAPEKMLQTMVSMVSQHTANDAWAADNTGTSLTSVEDFQGGYLKLL